MQQNIAWQIELLRMTFFFEMKERNRWESFWEAITHQSPESKTEKTTVLQTIEEGTWNKHSLTVALQSNRIDIVWHSKDVEEAVLPNLGESNSFETFIESITSALTENTLACINRAAFGAVLLAPTETRDEAYLLLSKYLPSVKISLNSRDFTYQINRPIPSKVKSEREVNRFSKWAAIQATYVDLQQNSFNIVANACRLELDISTSSEKLYQESEPITSNEILEFIELASHIATNGDTE